MLVLGKLFQSSLMFVGKARSLPLSGEPERYFNQIFSGKYYTRLEKFARDKHFNLVQKFVNYGRKFFIILAPAGIRTIKLRFISQVTRTLYQTLEITTGVRQYIPLQCVLC